MINKKKPNNWWKWKLSRPKCNTKIRYRVNLGLGILTMPGEELSLQWEWKTRKTLIKWLHHGRGIKDLIQVQSWIQKNEFRVLSTFDKINARKSHGLCMPILIFHQPLTACSLMFLSFKNIQSWFWKYMLVSWFSDTLLYSTGLPQGCILSLLPSMLYSNDCKSMFVSRYKIKFTDHSVLASLLQDHEVGHGPVLGYFLRWCDDSYMQLNVSKAKDTILAFRKKSPVIAQTYIN